MLAIPLPLSQTSQNKLTIWQKAVFLLKPGKRHSEGIHAMYFDKQNQLQYFYNTNIYVYVPGISPGKKKKNIVMVFHETEVTSFNWKKPIWKATSPYLTLVFCHNTDADISMVFVLKMLENIIESNKV